MKTIFFDVETSGTDHTRHGILQLAGIIEINDVEVERFDFFMKPFPDQYIDEGALKANGITKRDIEIRFSQPNVVYNKFITLLDNHVDRFNRNDKFHLVGYNSRFDDGFLRKWFENNDNKYYGSYFFWPSLDVSNMVAVKYREWRHKFSNFQLMTVADRMKIDIDINRAHDAAYDVEVTRAIFNRIIQ